MKACSEIIFPGDLEPPITPTINLVFALVQALQLQPVLISHYIKMACKGPHHLIPLLTVRREGGEVERWTEQIKKTGKGKEVGG